MTGNYYLSNNANKRAFTGLAIGSFSGASTTVAGTEIDGGSGLGIVPRIGYELGLLRLTAEYNLAFEESVSNYFGIRLGFNVGGRYKG